MVQIRRMRKLKYLLVLTDSTPLRGEDAFLEMALDGLQVRGMPYRYYMTPETKTALKVVGRYNWDQYLVGATATVKFFEIWNCKPDLSCIGYQTFRAASGGIPVTGVAIEEWDQPL